MFPRIGFSRWLIWGMILALLLISGCTAPAQPTPTPPPTPTPAPTLIPTNTPTSTATATLEPTPNPTEIAAQATATAQAEREQAKEQLQQEIAELQQAFEQGYSYTLEEPYKLTRRSSDSINGIIADLLLQEFGFIHLKDGESLLSELEEIAQLAKEAGYKMTIHLDGTINLHGKYGAKYPIYLQDWQIVYRGSHFDFNSWNVKGPGINFIKRMGYERFNTSNFLTDSGGKAINGVYKTQGQGEQKFRFYLSFARTSFQDNDTYSTSLSEIQLEYNASYESISTDNGGVKRNLDFLPGTQIEFIAP